MRVVIAAGGTGGHIYPGLTIANELKARYPQGEILFVGTQYGLEKDIVPRAGYSLELISVQYIRRALSLDLVKTGLVALKGLVQSLGIIRQFKPDVVIGTGGYVAGPVLLAAALSRVPTFIQEQNAFPGITNRLLGRFMSGIALGYPEAGRYFPKDGRVIVTGNPIRREIAAISREEGIGRLQLRPDYRTVVVFGGSQGGLSINRAMRELAPRLKDEPRLQVIHQTGKKSYEAIARDVLGTSGQRKEGLPPAVQDGCIRIVPYIYDMPAALAAADLVVGRAGALSIAEITVRGLPAILIPFPHAAENHQEKNARVLEQAGAARVILDRDVNADTLGSCIFELLGNPELLARMAAASRELGRADAVQVIADRIADLAGWS
ncbi:MAG: undecaprenyldiphospho-muramoylpentapeptide beta-N-acetylglucosaminyltransferase [Firmicutes bacterium]|nr:undecaprenyldiphospho-muramoylpentapeptide beta-N-acetylglucosaminyltransferase [Bacillota bacterium]